MDVLLVSAKKQKKLKCVASKSTFTHTHISFRSYVKGVGRELEELIGSLQEKNCNRPASLAESKVTRPASELGPVSHQLNSASIQDTHSRCFLVLQVPVSISGRAWPDGLSHLHVANSTELVSNKRPPQKQTWGGFPLLVHLVNSKTCVMTEDTLAWIWSIASRLGRTHLAHLAKAELLFKQKKHLP